MTPQEQEHLDHVAGCATEHQNSHAQSQIENNARESVTAGKIATLTGLGLHVAIEVTTAYCRATDGIIGTHTSIMGAFPTKGAAEAFLAMYLHQLTHYDGESAYHVRSPLPKPPTKKCFVRHISEPETSREAEEDARCPF